MNCSEGLSNSGRTSSHFVYCGRVRSGSGFRGSRSYPGFYDIVRRIVVGFEGSGMSWVYGEWGTWREWVIKCAVFPFHMFRLWWCLSVRFLNLPRIQKIFKTLKATLDEWASVVGDKICHDINTRGATCTRGAAIEWEPYWLWLLVRPPCWKYGKSGPYRIRAWSPAHLIVHSKNIAIYTGYTHYMDGCTVRKWTVWICCILNHTQSLHIYSVRYAKSHYASQDSWREGNRSHRNWRLTQTRRRSW